MVVGTQTHFANFQRLLRLHFDGGRVGEGAEAALEAASQFPKAVCDGQTFRALGGRSQEPP